MFRSETELYENEDEGEHIYFEPVVPLPDKVILVFRSFILYCSTTGYAPRGL